MKPNTKIGTITAVILLAIILYTGLASAPSTAASSASGPVTNVSMTDYQFTPDAIVVGAPNTTSGEFATIVWTNNGFTDHTVTSGNANTTTATPDGLFDSGIIPRLGTFTLQINQTMYNSIIAKYPDGFVHYYCSIHYSLAMFGTLTVSSTQVPEFSLPTLLLTIAMIFAVLLYAARSKSHKVKSS